MARIRPGIQGSACAAKMKKTGRARSKTGANCHGSTTLLNKAGRSGNENSKGIFYRFAIKKGGKSAIISKAGSFANWTKANMCAANVKRNGLIHKKKTACRFSRRRLN